MSENGDSLRYGYLPRFYISPRAETKLLLLEGKQTFPHHRATLVPLYSPLWELLDISGLQPHKHGLRKIWIFCLP
jgi:hypothetical protein